MTRYYRKFVKNYGKITTPLTTLRKKDEISWSPEATKTFEYLKEAMCQEPILAMPNITKTFIVECDASGNGIGVVLMQEERSIAFESHKIKESIYTKLFMRRKCWQYYMHLRNGDPTYWEDTSR